MIRRIEGMEINISPKARIAENASVIGEVVIGDESNIWYGAVVRGDMGSITIGCGTAVEDNATVHGKTEIGNYVTIGHNAIVHNCIVEDGCMIGMGAVVMDGAVIGKGSLIAAGCLVTQGKIIPPGSLVMGVPGKVCGEVSEENRKYLEDAVEIYSKLAGMQLPLAGE